MFVLEKIGLHQRTNAIREMDIFTRATIILCLYGIVKELRPSESFLTPYLKGPRKNFTEEQVDNEIYPVWTYSYLSTLFAVFLLTDLLKYKPVILFEGVTYIVTWVLLIWGRNVLTMQFMQFTYGLATGTEVAYYTYIYAAVPEDRYQKVTSYVRVANLSGRLIGATLGQILVSAASVSYYALNFISMSTVGVALIIAMFLPSVTSLKVELDQLNSAMSDQTNDYTETTVDDVIGQPTSNNEAQLADNEHTANDNIPDNVITSISVNSSPKMCQKVQDYFATLLKDFKSCYLNLYLLKWSVWWALATCGNFQVGNYMQNLWDEISPSRDNPHIYNGAVEAFATGLGALSAFLVGLWKVDWSKWGELLMGLVSLIDAAVLLVCSQSNSLWLAYVLYALFRASYQMVITVASFQVASQIKTDKYGLVFGCNTFLALLLQTIMTAIVVDKSGLGAPVQTQFVVYGTYFGLISGVFIFIALWSFKRNGCRDVSTEIYQTFS